MSCLRELGSIYPPRSQVNHVPFTEFLKPVGGPSLKFIRKFKGQPQTGNLMLPDVKGEEAISMTCLHRVVISRVASGREVLKDALDCLDIEIRQP